jgi:hypothetical protein
MKPTAKELNTHGVAANTASELNMSVLKGPLMKKSYSLKWINDISDDLDQVDLVRILNQQVFSHIIINNNLNT